MSVDGPEFLWAEMSMLRTKGARVLRREGVFYRGSMSRVRKKSDVVGVVLWRREGVDTQRCR